MSKPTYYGEAQLAGWSETHTGGPKLVFWLPDSECLSTFKSMTARKGNVAGQRFMLALVEIGDDEQPVLPEPGPEPTATPLKGGELAKLAGRLCGDEDFQAWVAAHWNSPAGMAPDDRAASIVRSVCGITSRAELDHNEQAASIFHEQIRRPYSKYAERRQPQGASHP